MKQREKQIVDYIIQHHKVPISALLEKFHISKRTLYYDIESINFHIKQCGQVKNINGSFMYIGQYALLQDRLRQNQSQPNNVSERMVYILYQILNGVPVTIGKLEEDLGFSKNTIVQTMEETKEMVASYGLTLVSKPKYNIVGDENTIRNLFLVLMQEDNNLLNHTSKEVLLFDKTYNINLTDYSIASITKFLAFLRIRFAKGFFIPMPAYAAEVKAFDFYQGVKILLNMESESEAVYLCAYIASCSSLNFDINAKTVDTMIEKLILRFEGQTAVFLERKEDFVKSIRRHLLSSYYRIKYKFPINNPCLDEIKVKHAHLFHIIHAILNNKEDFPAFEGIRDEETGFIATYFGTYAKGYHLEQHQKNRVLIICPNGLMISKSLELQLYQSIPTIEVVGVIPIKELAHFQEPYDYIITTVPLLGYENVIVVNPLLTKPDIDQLMLKLVNIKSDFIFYDIQRILDVVKQNAIIRDEGALKRGLIQLLYPKNEKEQKDPMLNELLNADRIHKVKEVKDWKEAITIASKPLLEDGSIEPSYVDAMIDAVVEFGPYMVLADRFALPHSSARSGVNRVAMSLLAVEQDVDMLGKPVTLFIVLASTDNTSHLQALSALTTLCYEEKNLDIFRSGDRQAILDMIQSV